MRYALVEDNKIVKVGSRPRWFNDDGEPVSDEILADNGWYIILDKLPSYNEETEYVTQNDQTDWIIGENTVAITYTIHDRGPVPLMNLSPRQLLHAALSINVTEQTIVDMIEAIEDETEREVARIDWNKAIFFRRDHWLVEVLRVELDFDEEEFDALWRWAATIE